MSTDPTPTLAGPEEETHGRELRWSLWRRLLAYTLRERRQVVAFALLGSLVAGVDVAYPLVTRSIVLDLERGTRPDVLRYGLLYGVLTALLCLGVKGFVELGGRVRTRVAHDIRADAFGNLQDLSFSFYDHRPVGWLMARTTSDCERLSNIMAWGLIDSVWGVTLMCGIVAVLFHLQATLAAVTLGVVPLLAWVSVRFQRRILQSSRLVRRTNSRLTAAYNEGITGVRTTKVFAREEENLAEFSALAGEMHAASVRNQLQSALYLPIVLTLGSLATGLALVHGGHEVLDGALPLGTLIAFLTLGAHFFQPVQELAHWFAEMQMAQASAERVLGLVEEVPDISDSDEVRRALARAPHGPGLAPDGLPDRIGRIEFRGVGFAYGSGRRPASAGSEPEDRPSASTHPHGRGRPVLSGFDLVVEPGETVALVGPTGGGKSTIVSLLCRFYEPTAGEIRIDGVDYRRRGLAWFQSKLGIVLQTPHLFSGTVRENIRYGRLDATDAEVEEAARVAGADAVARQLERGWDTEVGEDGSRLSVGQKQLVSFARAVLADPAILVMDEATSSIDTETERRIQAGLARVLAGRTSFVIAHRLSTIRAADRILVIDGGRIAEAGTHAELLALRGTYHDLYTQQSLRETGAAEAVWGAPAAEDA